MNQYQSGVYLFERIFHIDSKYDHEIPQFTRFVELLTRRLHSPAAVEQKPCDLINYPPGLSGLTLEYHH